MVHRALDVVADAEHRLAVGRGHHSVKAFGKTLVVEHDEDDIEEDYKPAQHTYDEADAACDNRPGGADDAFKHLHAVLTAKQLRQIVKVDVLLYYLMYAFG